MLYMNVQIITANQHCSWLYTMPTVHLQSNTSSSPVLSWLFGDLACEGQQPYAERYAADWHSHSDSRNTSNKCASIRMYVYNVWNYTALTQSRTARLIFILNVRVEKCIRFGTYVSIMWLKDSTEKVSRHWRDMRIGLDINKVPHKDHTYSAKVLCITVDVGVTESLAQCLNGLGTGQLLLTRCVVGHVARGTPMTASMVPLEYMYIQHSHCRWWYGAPASIYIHTIHVHVTGAHTHTQHTHTPCSGLVCCQSSDVDNLLNSHSSSWPSRGESWHFFLIDAHHT